MAKEKVKTPAFTAGDCPVCGNWVTAAGFCQACGWDAEAEAKRAEKKAKDQK